MDTRHASVAVASEDCNSDTATAGKSLQGIDVRDLITKQQPSTSNTQRMAARRLKKRKHDSEPVEVPGSLEVFVRRSPGLTLQEAQTLTRQLGYPPLNLIRVGAYSRSLPAEPVVAELYPLLTNNLGGRYDSSNARGMPGWRRRKANKDKAPAALGAGEHDEVTHKADNDLTGDNNDNNNKQALLTIARPKPFPTMLWMTQSALHARVCKLEDAGWIVRLDKRLKAPDANGAVHRAAMEAAHRSYAAARWALLTEEDRQYLSEQGWEATVRDTGVAGIHDFHSVKCLHGHYAHFLSRPQDGNIIGQWVDELLANADDATVPRKAKVQD